MVLGFNNMNMLNMNGNMFGMNMFGSGNMLNQLFSGTGSIFGGGFNMFGSNMFGGGCSLFTNCNGSVNYDAMAGWGVGMALLNVGGAALSSVMADKKASSPDAIEADIDGIQDRIDAELDKLGSDVTEDNYKDYDVKTEDWYTDKKAEIDKNLLSNEDLATHKATVESYKKAEKDFLAAESTDENYESLKTAYNNIKDQGKLAEEKIEAHEQAEKDLKALEAKAKKEQEKVDIIKDKITDLIEKRNNAQAMLDTKILDKADGKDKKLISDDDYNNAINSHGDDNNENNVKFTKAHLQKAANKYRKAQTEQDKEKYKKEFNMIYTWLLENNSGEISKDLMAAAEIMQNA